jgi:hypothetical protein
LQAPRKSVEGKQHPDPNAQFEYINAQAQDCLDQGKPFISVDTKKKELVGNFQNGGHEWRPIQPSSATPRTAAGSSSAPVSIAASTGSAGRCRPRNSDELSIERAEFHGDWNYVIRPRVEKH